MGCPSSTSSAVPWGETCGVPVEEIVERVKNGVRKVNLDTCLSMASTGSIRRRWVEHSSNFDPRHFLQVAMAAMSQICKDRYQPCGSAGMADRIKPLSLEDMERRDVGGELDPKIN